MSTEDDEQPTNRRTNRDRDRQLLKNNPKTMLIEDQQQRQHS